MNEKVRDKIFYFLNQLNTEIDVIGLVTIEDIELDNAFSSITDMIEYNDGFNGEILYYVKAIEYLQEHDPSLKESLELANDMGYTTDKLDSELLATLLNSENIRNNFYELEEEITSFFEELNEEIENPREIVYKIVNGLSKDTLSITEFLSNKRSIEIYLVEDDMELTLFGKLEIQNGIDIESFIKAYLDANLITDELYNLKKLDE